MSSEALAQIITRASTDAGFRQQLVSDPEGVGAASGLTTGEMTTRSAGSATLTLPAPGGEGLSRRCGPSANFCKFHTGEAGSLVSGIL